MEITATDVILEDLVRQLSLTLDEAFSFALQSTSDQGELPYPIYELLLSKLSELEQNAFTMILASNGIVVLQNSNAVDVELHEANVPVQMTVVVEEPPMTLDELQEMIIEEEEEEGEITASFYDEMIKHTDVKTAMKFNGWLVKTGLKLEKGRGVRKNNTPITDNYKKRVRRKLHRRPSQWPNCPKLVRK